MTMSLRALRVLEKLITCHHIRHIERTERCPSKCVWFFAIVVFFLQESLNEELESNLKTLCHSFTFYARSQKKNM